MNLVTINNVRGYIDENGTAWLKLEDVARGLGFTTVATSGNECVRWSRVEQYLTELGFNKDNGYLPDDTFIPENIFYRLAMKAKNETAEKFQAIVADEILPTIRKTGSYIALPKSYAEALRELAATVEAKEQLAATVERMKPKELFADSVVASNTSILIGELAKILKQNGIDVGQNRLFDWLRKKGYLISRQGTDYNMPTQRSMDLGLFIIKETVLNHSDGHVSVSKTPKVTGKGQVYFVNKFLEKEVSA
jgi:anti-repressor protein